MHTVTTERPPRSRLARLVFGERLPAQEGTLDMQISQLRGLIPIVAVGAFVVGIMLGAVIASL